MNWRLVPLVAAACVLLPAPAADACTCRGPVPACQAVWEVDAVFLGFVQAVDRILPAGVSNPGGTQPVRGGFFRVRITVLEVFRGRLPAEVDVITGSGGGDCGYAFEANRPYLVHASRDAGGGLHTSICQNTGPAEQAAADLDYLRTLNQVSSPLGMIFGTAQFYPDRNAGPRPFAGARVTASSDATQAEAVTGSDGSYKLRVPPGTYRLDVEVPDGLRAGTSWPKVEIRDVRGCARADVGVRSNGRMAGRILTARGEPLASTSVSLYELQRSLPTRAPLLSSRYTTRTDAAGAFEFSGVAAGSYLVGVALGELNRSVVRRPLLYPGTTDPDVATMVTITPGGHALVDDYVLPASIVFLRGVVRTPDGRPVPDVNVVFWSLEDTGQWSASLSDSSRTDSSGVFQFPVRIGLLYRIEAGPGALPPPLVAAPSDPARRRKVETPVFEVTPDLLPLEILLPD